jgi:hypothetical protein
LICRILSRWRSRGSLVVPVQPDAGVVAHWLKGLASGPAANGDHVLIMAVIAATWKQISYNLFFLADPVDTSR